MLDSRLDWWRRDIMVHLHKIRDLCEKRFDSLQRVTCPKLEGTYLMFPSFDYGVTSEELNKHLLEKAKIALEPGHEFGSKGEGHLRFCIATSEAIINEAFDRIEKALTKLN
jgi:aspartate/methionine/tyrosine aminotransferase